MEKINKNRKQENKKSQFKIQQMSFMLMAVVIFFILAGLFYLTIIYRNVKQAAAETAKEQAISLALRLADTAEFTCERMSNCIDADKVMILKDKKEYKGFWQVASIKIEKIYPVEPEKECTFQNYPNCSSITIYKSNKQKDVPASSYVSLCRKENTGYNYDKCEIARFIIEPEKK